MGAQDFDGDDNDVDYGHDEDLEPKAKLKRAYLANPATQDRPASAKFLQDFYGIPDLKHLILMNGINCLELMQSMWDEQEVFGYKVFIGSNQDKNLVRLLNMFFPGEEVPPLAFRGVNADFYHRMHLENLEELSDKGDVKQCQRSESQESTGAQDFDGDGNNVDYGHDEDLEPKAELKRAYLANPATQDRPASTNFLQDFYGIPDLKHLILMNSTNHLKLIRSMRDEQEVFEYKVSIGANQDNKLVRLLNVFFPGEEVPPLAFRGGSMLTFTIGGT